LTPAPAPASDGALEQTVRIVSISTEPLEVPLVDPFVIATARVDVTPSVLVRVEVDGRAGRAVGLGEAACLPPVTREGPADVHAALRGVAPALRGRTLTAPTAEGFAALVGGVLDGAPVARAGMQVALLDAVSRSEGRHLLSLLDPAIPLPRRLVSDITLPILPIERMVALAERWRARGFRTFKVKVGHDLDQDAAALLAVSSRVPDARFRLDANAGFTATEAVALLRACLRAGLRIECFEQPCAREDLDGLEAVQAAAPAIPVLADESLRGPEDLDAILARRGRIGGVNLKIVKLGGLLEALALGRRARDAGLRVMVGGMVETRLGMSAAACLAACFDDVLADLDTAWLLASDPFTGGYDAEGEVLAVGRGSGHGVSLAPRAVPG
jgi:L-alanine-DL-glutamate epimerase-like enolase superfamily enzyme